MTRVLSLAFVLLAGVIAPAVGAEVTSLRVHGNTLIEAEHYSASSKENPSVESCIQCSGELNLGFMWKSRWFEIEVNVPRSCDFTISLRASSITGTSVEVQRLGSDSQILSRLGEIKVPKTREWKNYTDTAGIKVSLASGTHTLRFKNLGEGVNVDFVTFTAASEDSVVSYYPPKNSGPDKNPLKGFSSGWWRPNDDYATVGFQYIEWGQLEPQDDQFDWEYVEEVLHREGTRGRHLILQFVVDWDHREPVDENYVGPDWLLERVGEHRGYAVADDPSSRPMRATKYDHPVFVREATEAISVLVDYFKDDPRGFVLQAGPLGFFSEWHAFPRLDWSPSQKTKFAIADAYLKNLPPKLFTQIRYPDEPGFKPRPRVGYFNGSATLTEHGYAFGEAVEKRSLWQYGPITGDWPPDVKKPLWKRFFLTDEGQRFIKQAGYSTLLMPEHKEIKQQLPDWTPDGRFMSMHREMGYNLQVDRVRHIVTDAGLVQIELTLGNIGIAPFYQDWEVQLAILNGENPEIIELIAIDTDLRKLAPGKSMVLRTTSQTELDPNGLYQVGLRISQPGADETKPKRWLLDARNTYVVLANDVHVIEGAWNERHALEGGWHVLGDIATDRLETDAFFVRGSFRPAERSRSNQVQVPRYVGDDSDEKQWTELLDTELSQWEVFMGVPHTSVEVDWPSKSESGTEGTPMGLNNDPLNVFSVEEIDGEPVLHVTGEVYGGLTTLKEYENYHLSLQFKWGEKKWPPRVNSKRDSGLSIHCVGPHGAFWNVWKQSLECQIREDDCGDFIALADSGSSIRVRRLEDSDQPQFDPTKPLFHGTGYTLHGPSEEKPVGQWNTVEVYSIGQTVVFVVNGTPNMVLERTVHRTPDGWKPLTKGLLQIQSAAAEIYYRDIRIRPIVAFPAALQPITQPYVGEIQWFR